MDFSEERTNLLREKFLSLDVHDVNFDGKVFGEVSEKITIFDFSGVKPIVSLDAFPLKYHQEMTEVKSTMIKRGQKFVNLPAVHHCAYNGLAHIKRGQQKTVKFSVKGRLMVDPSSFRYHEPNYESPVIIRTTRRLASDITETLEDPQGDDAESPISSDKPSIQVKYKPDNMTEEEFLVCSPTILGFR